MVLTFKIDAPLPSMNELMAWKRKVRGKHDVYNLQKQVWMKAIQVQISKAIRKSAILPGDLPFEHPVCVEIDWYEKNRRRDPDNVFGAVKIILDACVEHGVLRDDSQRSIAEIHHGIDIDRDNPRVVVRLSSWETR